MSKVMWSSMYSKMLYEGFVLSALARKTNNLRASPDNTKNCQIPLPNHHSKEAIDILQDIGLAEIQEVNKYGCEPEFRCSHPYFTL